MTKQRMSKNKKKQKNILSFSTKAEKSNKKGEQPKLGISKTSVNISTGKLLVEYAFFKKTFLFKAAQLKKDKSADIKSNTIAVSDLNEKNEYFLKLFEKIKASIINNPPVKRLKPLISDFGVLQKLYKQVLKDIKMFENPKNMLLKPDCKSEKYIFTINSSESEINKKGVSTEIINNESISLVSNCINFYESNIKENNELSKTRIYKTISKLNNINSKPFAIKNKFDKILEKEMVIDIIVTANNLGTEKEVFNTEKQSEIALNSKTIKSEEKNTSIIDAEKSISVIFKSNLQKIIEIEEKAKKQIEKEKELKNSSLSLDNKFEVVPSISSAYCGIQTTKEDSILLNNHEMSKSTDQLTLINENQKSSVEIVEQSIFNLENINSETKICESEYINIPNNCSIYSSVASVNSMASLTSTDPIYIDDNSCYETESSITFIENNDTESLNTNLSVEAFTSLGEKELEKPTEIVYVDIPNEECLGEINHPNESSVNFRVFDSTKKEETASTSNEMLFELFSQKPFIVDGSSRQPFVNVEKKREVKKTRELHSEFKKTNVEYENNKSEDIKHGWFNRFKQFFYCCGSPMPM